jgi:membrane protease YdiL (CAAX protease family)
MKTRSSGAEGGGERSGDATPASAARLLYFAMGGVACVLLYLFLLNVPPVSRNSPSNGLVPVLVLALTTAWLTATFLRGDRMSPAALGLTSGQRPVVRFVAGFVGGCLLVACWGALLALITGMRWRPSPDFVLASFVVAAMFNLFNNIGEELVYRGYLFVRLAERWGVELTIVPTSAVFALLHLQSGIPWQSVVAVVFTSGLIFGAIFARWESLPLALGFHVATNVAQDALGVRMSDASIVMPQFVAPNAGSGERVLIAIAVVNIAVATGVLTWRGRESCARRRANRAPCAPIQRRSSANATGRRDLMAHVD